MLLCIQRRPRKHSSKQLRRREILHATRIQLGIQDHLEPGANDLRTDRPDPLALHLDVRPQQHHRHAQLHDAPHKIKPAPSQQ